MNSEVFISFIGLLILLEVLRVGFRALHNWRKNLVDVRQLVNAQDSLDAYKKRWKERGQALDRLESQIEELRRWVPVPRDASLHAGDEYRVIGGQIWVQIPGNWIGQFWSTVEPTAFGYICEVRRVRNPEV